jgi:ribosomal protein S18 acetylase RimI-like enzyme
MNLEYRTLEESAIHEIHQCFLDAFSDYIVDIRTSEAMFREMNALRAVDYSLSVGAFIGKRMVGLTLNAKDQWNGKLTAYDAGTGVIPAFRGRGISRAMMQKVFELLDAQGFQSYLLEVITRNEKALKLYQSLDFQITRRLECFVLKGPLQLRVDQRPHAVRDVTPGEIPQVEEAYQREAKYGFQASWQNGWNTIRRRPDLYRLVASWEDGQCLGYGVIGAGRGGIAQLWVRRDRRRQGLGSVLLRELMARSLGQKTYSWVNVDERAGHTLNFLKAVGFTEQLAQFEMEKALHPASARTQSHPE